jgi:hypothetical protein
MADENPNELKRFESYSSCVHHHDKALKTHPRFRSFVGYGNNLKNQRLETPGTHDRFGPNNYNSGIRRIRKSATNFRDHEKSKKELLNPDHEFWAEHSYGQF